MDRDIDVLVMGELLVEIMRDREGSELYESGVFLGPYPSGAPAICISSAARLGCKTAIIGGVGKDDFGSCITDRLKKYGVDVSRVIESNKRATGCAFVTYFKDGSRKFIFHMGNTPAVEAKAPAEDELPDVKYMHIMGCSLMADRDFAEEILKTMRRLKKRGCKISFDPNIRKELYTDSSFAAIIDEVMQNTDIFLPGVEELLMLSAADNVEDAIESCFSLPSMEIVLLKKGSRGSTLYTKNSKEDIGAYKIVQKDATGAGDCFDGAFLAGLVQGKSLNESAKMAAAAGALNAAAFGPMEGDISEKSVFEMIEANA